jgi:lipopolysaccharide transport system permease protein
MLYNDVAKIISMGLSFLMYATPVYAIPRRFNENADGTQLLTPLVLTARDLIVGQSPEYLMYYFWIMLMYSFVFSWDWYFLPNFYSCYCGTDECNDN